MTTEEACFIDEWYIDMHWPLSWDDDKWRSMFHIWGIHYNALTVVMRRWQLTEHASYLRKTLLCSDLCHETMTTDRACFIPEEDITMLWPLSWDDGNCRSMFHTLGMNNHALTVVIRRWQLIEHIFAWGIYYHALTVFMRRWQLTEHVSYLKNT